MPWPHYVVVAPDITGVVTKNGKPLANTVVHYNVDKPFSERECKPSSISTSTNDKGEFHLKSSKDFEAIIYMGDRLFNWAVCFEIDGKFVLGRVNTNECIGDQREMNEEHENAIQFVESGEDTAKAL